MSPKSLLFACSLSIIVALAGCGGGDGGTLVTTVSPGGIWAGTDSATGLQIKGIVDESGHFHFIRSDLAQFAGTANSSGTSVSANFEGFAQFGKSFDDGSTHGTGSFTGTVSERSSLALTYKFTTDSGTASNGTLNLSYNTLYDLDSSLAVVSGNYTDTSSGNTVSVSGSGAVTSQDPTTLCVANGQVSVINSMYNAYSVTYTLANCTGPSAVLNGVPFTGLATLNNSNPSQLIIAVTGQAAATKLALVLTLNHQ